MKFHYLAIILSLYLLSTNQTRAQTYTPLSTKLAGKILLQVEENGEAWYLNPENELRYNLGKPKNAFIIMRTLGIGIKNSDLEKIPIALNTQQSQDSDQDKLPDSLETTIGTNPNNSDTDNDGYSDFEELNSHFNPNGTGSLNIDHNFAKKHLGKIFLQVENNGEAWYISPDNAKRYYLGKPTDAFNIMKELGLGITNSDLKKIKVDYSHTINLPTQTPPSPTITPTQGYQKSQLIPGVANAIRANDTEKALSYFTKDKKHLIEYSLNFLDTSGLLTLGNLLSSTHVESSTETREIHTTEIFFNGEKIKISFTAQKQPNGKWLLLGL